jgi:hypothetical protein
MDGFEDTADKKIREAMERGEFDDLPGKGKPLKLDEDAFVPEELRLAYHLLKSNGYAPEWIELGEEIEIERDRVEQVLSQGSLVERRDRFARLRGEIEALNRKIFEYNLRAPLPNLHKQRVKLPPDLAAE